MRRAAGARRVVFRLATVAFLLASLGCSGEDDASVVTVADSVAGPDAFPDSGPPAPECDPEAEPSGCDDGALCWFGRCAAVSRTEFVAEGAETRVGAVASLPAEEGDAWDGLVAFHTWSAASGPEGQETRLDALWVTFLDDALGGAPLLLEGWTAAADDPGPTLAVVRGPAGRVAVVRGPNPVRAYLWQDGAWQASDALPTEALVYTHEGDIAAVFDGDGRLHVAFHDLGASYQLAVATLEADSPGGGDDWELQRFDELPWGARLDATMVAGRPVFVHVDWGDPAKPADRVRGALLVELDAGGGWRVSAPSLSEGLTIEGFVLGVGAHADAEGRLAIAWMNHRRQVGVAVRGTDGMWTQDVSHLSSIELSDDLPRNLRLSWWQDVAVVAWLGYPERECDCFDLRVAMRRDGAWNEHRVARFSAFEAGGLGLSVDARGLALLPVGGGAFTQEHGTEAALLFSSRLPDWTAP